MEAFYFVQNNYSKLSTISFMYTYHKVLSIFILIKKLKKRQSFEFLPTYDYNYIETGTDINRANLL